MRSKGSGMELEHRRRLGVRRVQEGWPQRVVATFLEVSERTVGRWMNAYRRGGEAALAARPHPGPPARLAADQQAEVLSWLHHNPQEFGFDTDLWTAPRVAQVIEQQWAVHYHPRYLNAWLQARGVSPQKPRLRPRERDEDRIQQWRDQEWPRIKKKGSGPGR